MIWYTYFIIFMNFQQAIYNSNIYALVVSLTAYHMNYEDNMNDIYAAIISTPAHTTLAPLLVVDFCCQYEFRHPPDLVTASPETM